MAIREWHEAAEGSADPELGLPRLCRLTLHAAAPDSGAAEGLVFVIPDLPEDIEGPQLAACRRHLAEKHRLLAVSVEYHAYRSKLGDGAKFDIGEELFKELRNICASNGVTLLYKDAVARAITQLPAPCELELPVRPANGDYQNLGLVAALDHLQVFAHLRREGRIAFDAANVIVMGNGYGGYLAHLVAKIAPHAIRAVIDFAGRMQPPASFLFGGLEPGPAPYYYHFGKSRIFPLVHTEWEREAGSPRHYSPARMAIRDVAREDHARAMLAATARPPVFCGLVSILDASPETTAKLRQLEMLRQLGFGVIMRDIGDIDGSSAAIEQTEHGPVISLPFLFDGFYGQLGEPLPAQESCSVAYPGGDLIYSFSHDAGGCRVGIAARPQEPRKPLRFY